MSDARQFYATPGEPIRPKLQALAKHIASTGGVQSGRGIRRHVYGNGSSIVADADGSAFVGAFSVRVVADKATVGIGTVEDVIPRINDTPIDGINAQGEQGVTPELSIVEGPNPELRSWICVEVLWSAESKGIAEVEEALIITHRNDLPVVQPAAIKGVPLRIIKPLAMLIWQSESVVGRVRQITFFDQRVVSENEKMRLVEAA